jgi:hypothetical protein
MAPRPDAAAHPDAATRPDASIDASPDAAVYRFECDRPPPPGAPQPIPPPPYTGGMCPVLVAGNNTITSTGHTRQFILVVPANLSSEEKLPVLVMWHWLGGSPSGFLDRGEVQQAADAQRFLAIIPYSEGAMLFGQYNLRWPFDITMTSDRMNEEHTFFDDMLACAEAQFNVNQNCVSTIGVSAGALYSDQLAQARSYRLSSFVSLSGGVGDTIIRPWSGSAHILPSIVLWGGDGPPRQDGIKDILGCFGIGMDFSVASHQLESNLTSEGHFFVECIHNCGHVEPPLTPPPGESKFAGIWGFVLNHPFWLAPGDSPYLRTGLPPTLPQWCGIGAGSATPRSGSGCPQPENPCAF